MTQHMALRILFAASEAYPLVKTGGLADVVGSLPDALRFLGAETCIALPGYRGLKTQLHSEQRIAQVPLHGCDWDILVGRHPDLHTTIWLFDCPELFDRPGDPYHDADQQPWMDNGFRFGWFSEAVAIAADTLGFDPDVVHAHDWQTGLVMPWLQERRHRARRVFTIHNIAYQGCFDPALANTLGLPWHWWDIDGIEFHGQWSALKAGIAYADAITTVSPSYAYEIQTAYHGFGMEGLLRARSAQLHGILNGIDDSVWNPRTDPLIGYRYDARRVAAGKRANRTALQERLGLAPDPDALLVGVVTRFAYQKGMDLLCELLPELHGWPLQFAVLGNGSTDIATSLRQAQAAMPGRIGFFEGFDEALAHGIIAGSDAFLMPSRYEPCGLTQMYSLRYGTVPLVHRTGGLADTIVDATPATLADGSATGVQFQHADVGGIRYALGRALELRGDSKQWKAMQREGMAQDFSWGATAASYLQLYRP